MKRAILSVLAMLLLPSLVLAQAQGRIKGTVTDTKGKPITTAKVIITCPDMSTYKKELTVDNKGVFTTLIVDATKNYLFHAEAPGYQTIEQLKKPLIGGQTLEVPFVLKSVDELRAESTQEALEQPGIKELREGKDLLDAGRAEEARARFLAAVEARPDLHLAWLELSIVDLDAGRSADALSEAEKCVALQPSFAPCLAQAANAAKAKGDQALFTKYMTAYKNANPSDPAVLYNEAVAFLNKGDDAGARPLLEQAIEADDEYPDALYQLGMVFLRTGESARAKEMLQKFLKIAPNHKEAPTATEMLKYL